ncbi:hypothetical protein C8J57DRAFT_1728104 [Mycena rebaudengoi]|nr:hypothetical protein C8J57DRAFT_1728104 [Mycena rebaudengoi]
MFSEYLIFFASIAAVSALAIGPTPDVGTTVTLARIPTASADASNPGQLGHLPQPHWRVQVPQRWVSTAKIPAGFICTFFDNTDTDVVFLQGGSWNLNTVPGIAGTVNFNDKTSSLTCSTF